jgi:hypothetical protein
MPQRAADLPLDLAKRSTVMLDSSNAFIDRARR